MPTVKSSYQRLVTNALELQAFPRGQRHWRPRIRVCRVPEHTVVGPHAKLVDVTNTPLRRQLQRGETFVLHVTPDMLQQKEGDPGPTDADAPATVEDVPPF